MPHTRPAAASLAPRVVAFSGAGESGLGGNVTQAFGTACPEPLPAAALIPEEEGSPTLASTVSPPGRSRLPAPPSRRGRSSSRQRASVTRCLAPPPGTAGPRSPAARDGWVASTGV